MGDVVVITYQETALLHLPATVLVGPPQMWRCSKAFWSRHTWAVAGRCSTLNWLKAILLFSAKQVELGDGREEGVGGRGRRLWVIRLWYGMGIHGASIWIQQWEIKVPRRGISSFKFIYWCSRHLSYWLGCIWYSDRVVTGIREMQSIMDIVVLR